MILFGHFYGPYMRVIPNPKMAFIFPNSCILALIFPILIKYFPKCEGPGSFLKSKIKSLILKQQLLKVNWILSIAKIEKGFKQSDATFCLQKIIRIAAY